MIDATYLKSHRTATGLRSKKGGTDDQKGRLIGRTKGGMNTKLHAVTDAEGRPIRFFMTTGHISDYTGAAALLDSLPKADWLLADRGYDADWFREALKDKGIKPCTPKLANTRRLAASHDGSDLIKVPSRSKIAALNDVSFTGALPHTWFGC